MKKYLKVAMITPIVGVVYVLVYAITKKKFLDPLPVNFGWFTITAIIQGAAGSLVILLLSK